MSFGFKTRIIKLIEDVLSYRGSDFTIDLHYAQEYRALSISAVNNIESEFFVVYLEPLKELGMSVEDIDNQLMSAENFMNGIIKNSKQESFKEI